ncbi:hypothetical protein EVAR_41501_1 [Eumeta japonica]|uniref:Uncharacterized protein n=1 Tax=Eumeta variegata TaxID=151549 RepID=A0A4C1X4D8_EUMVA|nr:hypothetical protein EVAR_41501_1 [Eumeta japonica]
MTAARLPGNLGLSGDEIQERGGEEGRVGERDAYAVHHSQPIQSGKDIELKQLLRGSHRASSVFLSGDQLASGQRGGIEVVCGRCLSSTRTHRPKEWKRDRSLRALARTLDSGGTRQ